MADERRPTSAPLLRSGPTLTKSPGEPSRSLSTSVVDDRRVLGNPEANKTRQQDSSRETVEVKKTAKSTRLYLQPPAATVQTPLPINLQQQTSSKRVIKWLYLPPDEEDIDRPKRSTASFKLKNRPRPIEPQDGDSDGNGKEVVPTYSDTFFNRPGIKNNPSISVIVKHSPSETASPGKSILVQSSTGSTNLAVPSTVSSGTSTKPVIEASATSVKPAVTQATGTSVKIPVTQALTAAVKTAVTQASTTEAKTPVTHAPTTEAKTPVTQAPTTAIKTPVTQASDSSLLASNSKVTSMKNYASAMVTGTTQDGVTGTVPSTSNNTNLPSVMQTRSSLQSDIDHDLEELNRLLSRSSYSSDSQLGRRRASH